MFRSLFLSLLVLLGMSHVAVTQVGSVAINEMMVHPGHGEFVPEDSGAEFLELINPTDRAIDLSGWSFTRGIAFVFREGTILPAGGYLVVAADVVHFHELYPEVTAVVGSWEGRLSDAGETLSLVDAQGLLVDEVTYADDGDWSVRELGPLDHEHRGWMWSKKTDGGGYSLELNSLSLSNEHGALWRASATSGGTPGRENSVVTSDVAPLILEVEHRPLIPGPNASVTVEARLLDEGTDGLQALLCYRADTTSYSGNGTLPHRDAGVFVEVSMIDRGQGQFAAAIPAHPDGTVIEFYVRARDAAGNERTWPAPALVDGVAEQIVNALFRVDASMDTATYWSPGSQPLFYLVCKRGELEELYDISDTKYDGPFFASEAMSNAQMNLTLISVDGTGAGVTYRAGARNRGNRSRARPPMSFRLVFPKDMPWRGQTALNLNSQYTPLQILGSALFRLAGLAAAQATAVQVRVNGVDLAQEDQGLTYGSYVALESLDSAWAEHHFPADASGNLYRCRYYDDGYNTKTYADLDYKEPLDQEPDTNDYRDNYPKKTNAQAQDWSDVFHLIDVLNNPAIADDAFMAETATVLNHDKWARYFATDALIGNAEGGLGRHPASGDDYALYRGMADPRFWLVPHDLDTVLGQGSPQADPESDLLVYAEVDGLERLMNHPDMRVLYDRHLWALTEEIFDPAHFAVVAERLLGSWVPTSLIDEMERFVRERRDYVRQQVVPSTGSVPPGASTPMPPVRDNNVPFGFNEIMVVDGKGGPGWVELANVGDRLVDLTGMSLTRGDPLSDRTVFPAGTFLEAGGLMALSMTALGFDLDPVGDRVQLRDRDNTLLDSVTFGSQIPGFAIGRIGNDRAWGLTLPTFGTENVAQPLGDAYDVKINEWLASEQVTLASDFIELYNPDPDPADIGGLYLTDNLASLPTRSRVPDLSFIAGEGFAVFTADDRDQPGHLPFKLSSWGEVLALVDDQNQVVDSVLYGPQTTDVSEGRSPDGADDVTFLTLPTAGLSNPRITAAEAVTLVPLDQTWRYYQQGPAPEGWQQPPFPDGTWPQGPGLLYVENASLPGPKSTALEIGAQTYYFRTQVQVPWSPEDVTAWRLSTVVDDGVVVYVNGQEVLRLHMPEGAIDYTTRAADTVTNATVEGPFQISPNPWQRGDNLIAVEVHQTNSTSSDIVMGLTLEALLPAAEDAALAPLQMLRNGLRITEIMYHAPNGRDYDFLELTNIAATSLDITGVRLSGGIQYTFPPYLLAPDQRVVLVADVDAFRAGYGPDVPVLGTYQGNLGNGSDDLVLLLPAPHAVAILRFTYDDTWYPATDGNGQSLTVVDPQQAPTRWDDPAGWQAALPTPGW